ncbi:MAG: cell wall-active antibiotics response protein [Paenibacillaceae bacterium]|nr:MAG: cell wall-active antibiotics response protein [Paenibacillaceae bacterium]
MNMKIFGRVFWGLVLLAIGGLFLLRQLNLLPFDFDIGFLFSTFWPIILIAIGLQSLVSGGGWWGMILVGLGAFFQLQNLNFIHLSLGEVIRYGWPVLLIIWGLNMIFRPGRKKRSEGGWQSYPPKTGGPYHGGERPVPPPPPLHPNPLDLDYEPPKTGDTGADGHNGTSGHHGAGGHHGPSGWNGAGGWNGPGGRPKHAADDDRPDWMPNLNAENRSGFIGDIHLGGDYWELRPMNISLFIGDTVLDLTKAQIPLGETRINVSSFIGDVKVFVPNDRDLGISVTSNSFIGDTRVLDRHEGGFFKNVKFETPYYHEADKRIRLIVSSFIGDVRIVKVG